MTSLKQKTINGLFWSAIDSFAGQGILFIAGIILARMLTPREFGLIGMITVFIAISESFIASGFNSALIRKNDCTQSDYSTVFYFNLTVGISLFILLFCLAHPISIFFNEPELTKIIRILSSVLIIDSLTIIQRTTLIKRIDFKLQAKISVIAALGSGIISIILAYAGSGVWALVALQLAKQLITSILLWFWNHWKPVAVFSLKSFKELFGFGSKLLVSGLIDTIYRNAYYFIIGKYFSASQLGYYTRADQFNNILSRNMTSVISKVTYPVLSQMKDDSILLKAGYKRMIKSVMLITFTLMLGMAAISKPMIITLIGDKWAPSVIYLQLLCFVGMLYPLHALNLNILNVHGRSDLFLRLEIIKKLLAIPTIIIGIIWGIKIMIIGMIFNSLFSYYLNSFYSGRFINYSMKEQIMDILPSFLLGLFMAIIIYSIGLLLSCSQPIILIIQILLGALISFTVCEMTKMNAYTYLKDVVKSLYSQNNHGRK